jgi:predicted O-methyltransferase YrrM
MILTQSELTTLADLEAACSNSKAELGSVLQRDRIAMLADRACSIVEGDLLECGCYVGATSEILARIARKYERKLICVDTFLGGDDYHLDEIGKIFEKNMQPYWDVLIFMHDDFHAPQVIEIAQKRRYALVFLDNGHSTAEHISELETTLPVCDGLIAVDDVNFPGVRDAINCVLGSGRFPEWNCMYDPRLREEWLVKC